MAEVGRGMTQIGNRINFCLICNIRLLIFTGVDSPRGGGWLAMAQAAGQPAARRRQRLPYRKLLNRVSIQSKLILMLVACTVLAAAVVGAIAYKTGRDSLRAAAIDRLTELREAQTRALNDEIGALRNTLVTYTYAETVASALRDFTAGFDHLANATITGQQYLNAVGLSCFSTNIASHC